MVDEVNDDENTMNFKNYSGYCEQIHAYILIIMGGVYKQRFYPRSAQDVTHTHTRRETQIWML